ncbi:hypothetical protein KSS87_001207 [Heliosperma pusillum]|nr:hypothetical protein KSS87_001207 [Heliosperma pusillum]
MIQIIIPIKALHYVCVPGDIYWHSLLSTGNMLDGNWRTAISKDSKPLFEDNSKTRYHLLRHRNINGRNHWQDVR